MQFNSSEDQTENLRKFAKIFRVHPAICGGIGWAVGRGSSSFETGKTYARLRLRWAKFTALSPYLCLQPCFAERFC